MKTYKNLYHEISSFENLYESWRKARSGKRHGKSAATFEQNLDKELTHCTSIVYKYVYGSITKFAH